MICERIKELRKRYNFTQAQVAECLGVTKRTYYNYENKKTKISTQSLIKLSFYYNISVDYLIGLTNSQVLQERKKKNYLHYIEQFKTQKKD